MNETREEERPCLLCGDLLDSDSYVDPDAVGKTRNFKSHDGALHYGCRCFGKQLREYNHGAKRRWKELERILDTPREKIRRMTVDELRDRILSKNDKSPQQYLQ